MYHYFPLVLIFVMSNVNSTTYSRDDINRIIHTQVSQESSKEFVRGFFVAKDPKNYIASYASIHKNRIEPIHIEYKFYTLLSEVSHHSKQPYLQEFVSEMKNYETKAFVLHDEGRVPVAIYNLRAKAQGIENIWLAAGSLNKYIDLFEKDSIGTLGILKSRLDKLKTPQWLGLKNSFESISPDNHVLITDFLLSNPKNLTGLDKFVSHYTLFTGNKQLIQSALKHLDQSNSEFLLRKLKDYFNEDFVIGQLINTVENNKNQAFAISMMAPYLKKQKIKNVLFEKLKGSDFSSQAALVLAQASDKTILQDLENAYYNKNASENTKKQIVFVVKMSKLKESNVILTRLLDSQTNNHESAQWLKSFKGEVK